MIRPFLPLLLLGALGPCWLLADSATYQRDIEPLMMKYCFDCHGDGADKGEVDLDPVGLEAHLKDVELWERVWHNLRSQLMPPSDKKQPSDDEVAKLTGWIEREIFRLDPKNPDPGRVTIRRLNRTEYQNSIQDLLGYRFSVEDHFPPDDSGYGFENIGDVLSISPLLMEKFLTASQQIVEEAVPTGGNLPRWTVWGSEFKGENNPQMTSRHLPFGEARTVRAKKWVEHSGRYRLRLLFRTHGSDEATENSADLALLVNGKTLRKNTIGWDTRREISVTMEVEMEGKKEAVMELIQTPKNPPEEGEKSLATRVDRIEVTGPLDGSVLVYSDAYRRIFSEGPPPGPEDVEGRRTYARKILKRLATLAYRQPLEQDVLERLVKIAMITDHQPDNGFEHGIRQALAAVLASPQFLFRAEAQPSPNDPAKIVPLNEYALASRLSFFLWNSLPDEELLAQAGAGTLRQNLDAQVERLLKDPKAKRFSQNFTGQWLGVRDVPTINISARSVSKEPSYRQFNYDLRTKMREETEMLFHHVLQENRPATELLTADYTFLNDKLAQYYNLPKVEGREMQKVSLPPNSNRGGILRQASFHVVTSNPTRTSPVKRGLYVLENLLGTPAPPAPPDVPTLEEVKKKKSGNVTMREMMEVHREKALCKSCHARMDPIGLGFENYNAIGQWRASEMGKPVDASGSLITGEEFSSADELVQILATSRRRDFHRCLAEKLLVYALGRGVEYYDGPAIDGIVQSMEEQNGSLREAVKAVVASVPFQKRRGDG